MKSLVAGSLATLAVLAGCHQGGPGTPKSGEDEKPFYGQAENTLNLNVPVTSSSLRQGEETIATVGIKRGKNFNQDLTLNFSDVPKGVTFEPASPTIQSGDTKAKITVKAEDEAALGEFKVQVTSHPAKRGDAKMEFKLTVLPKDGFTLRVPSSMTLKRGEEQAIFVGIKRDKTFNQDVALRFSELPQGITHKPETPIIKQLSTEVKVVFTAVKDASLGDFGIQVTGHPAKGADASHEFKLTVAVNE